MNAKCAGCGKAHLEVRRMIALSNASYICDECVDMCSEIVHEDGGFVKIAVSELENLRSQARLGARARIWIDFVRKSVDRADAELPQDDQPTP